jgi:hypothetical protein
VRATENGAFGRIWFMLVLQHIRTGANMNIRHLIIPFAACAAGALAAQPAPAQVIKPGLWETNNKMGGNAKMQEAMTLMQQQMALLSPEQRQRAEGMMAKQGVSIGNDGVAVKMCITPEMAAQQQLPLQQRGNCSYQHAPATGNSMKFSFTCTNPQASGDGSVTFASPTAYTSSMRVTSSAAGSQETVNVDSTGRWVAADCGSIQPMTLPAAK